MVEEVKESHSYPAHEDERKSDPAEDKKSDPAEDKKSDPAEDNDYQ
jgi:hypothetical protein